MTLEPYRGVFGHPRPARLASVALPPAPMPGRIGLRALKAWRYVGLYSPELMVCLGSVRVGPFRQAFWAVWDCAVGRLSERTVTGRGPVRLAPGSARMMEREVQIELTFAETAGIETVCPSGDAYAWTRKQAGIACHGRVAVGGVVREISGQAVIDDTAAYYERHTRWQWSAGVGVSDDGRPVGWNLVAGVNDPPRGSERTVWVDGEAHEAPPCQFAPDLSAVDGLRFTEEAVRERRENRLLVRSDYRQPFGTFSGVLPGGVALAEGWGVMEAHDVRW
jgi:uncharacterized protein DUF2804